VLAEHLTVAENISLGRMPARLGFVDRRALCERARSVLARIGCGDAIRPGDRVKDLSAPQQGMVAIARALSREARVLLFDEPTAVLAGREVEGLFRIVRGLKEKGLAILYISHRMQEIFELCDTVTVLKDGRIAGEAASAEADADALIALMVGREVSGDHFDGSRGIGGELLRAEGLSNARLRGCSLALRAGEIVGLYGLVGAGRTELSRALFGADAVSAGTVETGGEAAAPARPREAIDRGLSLVPEDRRRHGLALPLSVCHNLNLAVYCRNQTLGLVRAGVEQEVALEFIERLAIRTPSLRQKVKHLSGGNQQKVVLGKWLARGARVFILDEPTNGVDVGAKEEIYRLINGIAREGAAVLFISSYMPELMGVCDRILVMNRGRLVRDVARGAFDERALLGAAIESGS